MAATGRWRQSRRDRGAGAGLPRTGARVGSISCPRGNWPYGAARRCREPFCAVGRALGVPKPLGTHPLLDPPRSGRELVPARLETHGGDGRGRQGLVARGQCTAAPDQVFEQLLETGVVADEEHEPSVRRAVGQHLDQIGAASRRRCAAPTGWPVSRCRAPCTPSRPSPVPGARARRAPGPGRGPGRAATRPCAGHRAGRVWPAAGRSRARPASPSRTWRAA